MRKVISIIFVTLIYVAFSRTQVIDKPESPIKQVERKRVTFSQCQSKLPGAEKGWLQWCDASYLAFPFGQATSKTKTEYEKNAPPEQSVRGGTGILATQFPEVVAIVKDDQIRCSGVLLAGNANIKLSNEAAARPRAIILTAKHCPVDKDTEVWVNVKVAPGPFVANRFCVDGSIPYYGDGPSNLDLQVLVLDRTVIASRLSINLNVSTAGNLPINSVVGFGDYKDIDNNPHSGTKNQALNLPIRSSNCSGAQDASNYCCMNNLEFVAGGGSGHVDTCDGDSGGPFYVMINKQAFLAGIVSRPIRKSTPECSSMCDSRDCDAPCGEGSVFVRVDTKAVSDWIQGILSGS